MKIFVDTSSLFKLYHKEEGTERIEYLFSTFQITEVFLSEFTKVEFSSTIWKKVRTKELSIEKAKQTIELFESDFEKFTFISTDSIIIEKSRILLEKYGSNGLRALDSIQLATATLLLSIAELFLTEDKLLQKFFEEENLKTIN